MMHERNGLAIIGGSLLGAIALLAGLPAGAGAHGVSVQSRTTNAVEIHAVYDSGEPMKNAQVQVYAPDDPSTPYFVGQTDNRGRFAFAPDQAGDWEIAVRQAGHGEIVVIPVESGGAIAATFTNDAGLTPLQRGVMAGAVTWGCVGTALYFRRGKA